MLTLYRAKYVLTMAEAGVIECGEVLVENEHIREVGNGLAALHRVDEVRDLGNVALLPGFVNAHSHLEYSLSRCRQDGLNFWDWIDAVGYRRDRWPSREELLASAQAGVQQCVKSGITCFGDCSFSGVAAEAIDSAGLRGVVYKELFGQSMGEEYPSRMAAVLDQARELQSSVSDRVKIGLSPHSVYTSNAEVLKLCAQSCAGLDIPVSLHVAETRAEAEYTLDGTGPIADMRRRQGYEPIVSGQRPISALRDAGLLRPGVNLAHCVDMYNDEIALIAASGASVAHCPRSNAYLGCGVFPYTAMRNAGAVVGLGTDSAASCLTLDFFEEMRFALGLHRAAGEDAGALLAKDVLALATAGGAAALGLGDEIGRLQPGMRADMIAVDMTATQRDEDVHLAVISRSPADVSLVLVDGKCVRANIPV